MQCTLYIQFISKEAMLALLAKSQQHYNSSEVTVKQLATSCSLLWCWVIFILTYFIGPHEEIVDMIVLRQGFSVLSKINLFLIGFTFLFSFSVARLFVADYYIFIKDLRLNEDFGVKLMN